MKVLVTGAAGFIGSNIALELEKQGHEVTAIDNLMTGSTWDNLVGFKGKKIEENLTTWKTEEKFDAIFHEAAITDPRYADDYETMYNNLLGFENILNLAKRCKASLIYASTAALYGNGPTPMQEDQPKDLQTAYARSKMLIDDKVKTLFDKMHVVGLRYFNVFGPNEAHKGRPASMIYHLTKQMLAGQKPKLFKMGEQKRDHIYVKDIVKANILALKSPSGIYNVGTGRGTTFNEIVLYINKALGTNLDIEYIDNPYDPKSYQANTQANTDKAKKFLQFENSYTPEEGVYEYVQKLKKDGK